MARVTLFLLMELLAQLSQASPTPPHAPFKVVLDPGHGGSDEGTVFEYGPTRIAEKDIALQLATEIKAQLEKSGVEVHLTRDGDQDLPLATRTRLANQWGADAFISIHMNSQEHHSSHSKKARSILTRLSTLSLIQGFQAQGTETFILNHTTDASSKRLAGLENSNPGVSAVPNQDVHLILKDLRLDSNLTESKRLACSVQTLLSHTTPLPFRPRDRGVKQALFHVLLGADMPSILLEAGFLTHPKDRAVLLDPVGRKTLGQTVAQAVKEFRDRKTPVNTCKVN